MAVKAGLEQVSDVEVLNQHLDALVALDDRLVPVLDIAGEVPLRARSGGFAGMAQIIVSQLLSVASANAIHGRFAQALEEVTAARFVALEEDIIRQCGISNGKYQTMCGLADAELSGALDYAQLAHMEAEEAIAVLTQFKGIGRWTAEIYLLFCLGHADIFPAGDLVLQKMAGEALGRKKRPDEKQTRNIAKKWSPYRGAAARLLWRYFAAIREREGVSL